MNIINVLPELFAIFFSLLVAFISFLENMTLKEVSINTIFSIFIFYIIGFALKSLIDKFQKDAKENKKKDAVVNNIHEKDTPADNENNKDNKENKNDKIDEHDSPADKR